MSLKAISNRITRLQKILKRESIDGCLIENPIDLFYFTGLKLSTGRLVIAEKTAVLLIDGRYLQAAKERAPVLALLDSAEAFIDFLKKASIRKLGFDGKHTSFDHLEHLKKQLKGSLIKLFSVSSLFNSARVIKDAKEIIAISKSADLLWKGFEFIRRSLKKGITEQELAKKFEIFCLERGADRLWFEPIIAFGANSAMPHYRAQDAALKEGDIVLIDIGIVVDHYHSDLTRVLFYKKTDPFLSRLYTITKRAQKSALSLCRPGVKVKEIDLAARRVMREENVEDLFIHSLGHGIGLEGHEFPRLKYNGEDKDLVLESGMVFTVEPGLYVPGKGGVRYEDTIVITPHGYTNFFEE